jgi:serine/threonine protein kinase
MVVTEQNGPADELIAGRYRLLERLGSGSMGVVWRAHDERLDRVVAVKLLLPAPGLSETVARQATLRALREARITARLQHPHAVTVHDVVEHDGNPCLVMEYVPSRSLAAILADRGPLPPHEVAGIGQQVAEALAAAHKLGIVHRDVKPDNVLLTEDGFAKITDFGISRTVGDGSLTGPGMIAGTPAYLPPEVAGGARAGFASDVFSLGATLYAAVEGGPPFGFDENTIALLHRVAAGEILPLRRAGQLTPVLLWMLRVEAAQRPGMDLAGQALGEVAAGRTVTPPSATLLLPDPGAGRPPRRGPRWRPAAIVLLAVALLAIGAVTGMLLSRGDPPGAAGSPGIARTRPVPSPPPASTTTPANSGCVADYSVTNSWPGGYQALVTVTNAGDQPLSGWTVRLQLPDGQTISSLWNGQLSQQGSTATVASLSYNAAMNGNGNTTFGFLGTMGAGSSVKPLVSCRARS